jgi:hypothetical protein
MKYHLTFQGLVHAIDEITLCLQVRTASLRGPVCVIIAFHSQCILIQVLYHLVSELTVRIHTLTDIAVKFQFIGTSLY